MSKAITANRLGDGRVVFRTSDGGWSLSLSEADHAADDAALAAAEADARNQIVIEPYAIDLDLSGAAARPAKLREAIRAFGPTIDYVPTALLQAAE